MRVDSVKNGIVLDHIECGKAMEIYHRLGLEELDCPVAILKNVPSSKMGRKDIIKIDQDIDINFDVVGYISSSITIDVVRGGTVVEKRHINLPETLTDVLVCRNPRCITSTEQDIHHIFRLTDKQKGIYRCLYCDTRSK